MSKSPSTFDLSKIGRTNLYYPDEERRLIHKAICRTEEALQRVRAEKRALTPQEEALQSDLERYLSAHAPIKRLPDNVLCNMFESYCQDASPVNIPLFSLRIPPQITISHVCSAWRQLVLDIPAFWCSILVDPEREDNIGEVMEVAHAWLSRAKSLPCSVDLKFKDSSWSQDWHRNIVKDLISPYKFKRLDVKFADYHLRNLLQLPAGKLSCIEDICLCYVERSNIVTSEPFEMYKLSSLTSFELLFNSLESDVSRFAGTPWHQLQHIKIHETLPVLSCLRILELSSDILETCFFEIHEDNSFVSSPSSIREPIHCSQLREFQVNICSSGTQAGSRSDSDDIIDPFLSLLRCPKLKPLTLGLQSSYEPAMPGSVNLQTLLKMQHISGMHLEELIIGNTARDLEVLPLLASFPSLRRIVLPRTINFTEEVMEKLGSGSIAPSLEDLTIKKSPALEKIFEMIKARSSLENENNTQKHKPTPFKSITLYGGVHEQMKYLETIKEINQSGVILKWFLDLWRIIDDAYNMDGELEPIIFENYDDVEGVPDIQE